MTVLRNDPFGSGREGRFDVCAVKRTEVDESRGRHEDQVLRAGTENLVAASGKSNLILLQSNRLAWPGQFQRTGDCTDFS